jgi:hypothetical protein
MKHGAILFAWVVVAAMQTLRCQGATCEVVPHSLVLPHRLSVFESRLICEDYRHHLEQQTPPVVRSQTRPDVTIRKQMTYTCQLGGLIP